MKVISLKQPWASLWGVIQLKDNETRSWPTKYRGPLAIHASKEIVPFDKVFGLSPWRETIMKMICERYGAYENLPTGQIIATCNLVDCQKVAATVKYQEKVQFVVLENGQHIAGLELHLGDYSQGRYIWIHQKMQMLSDPIPAKGRLGIWEHEIPEVER